jgi:hypothetical protein
MIDYPITYDVHWALTSNLIMSLRFSSQEDKSI